MRNAIKGGANRCSNIMRGNATEVNQLGEGSARPLSYYTGGVTKSTSLSPEHCDWTQPHKSPSSEVRIRCKVELLHQLLRGCKPPPRAKLREENHFQNFSPRIPWKMQVDVHESALIAGSWAALVLVLYKRRTKYHQHRVGKQNGIILFLYL